MRIEKRDGAEERRIITGMIVNPIVLGKIVEKWESELFTSRWANLVGHWCIDYYAKYATCPGHAIQGMFESWASADKDDATVELVEKFLSALSDDHEDERDEINVEHLIDVASRHFNRTKIRKLAERLQGHLTINQLEQAIDDIHSFGKVEIGIGAGVDVVNDTQLLRDLFVDPEDDVVTYPGALGYFMKGQLQRENFVAFTAPEKRGKTFWLLDMAFRGLLQRKRVAFFAVGDMTQKQMMRRFASRAARRPFEAADVRIPTKICHKKKNDKIKLEYVERSFQNAMTMAEAKKGMEWVRHRVRSKRTWLKLSCHPNNTLNVKGLESILQGWEIDGWVPDLIIIDYADILAPPAGIKDSREAINETWKQLRSMSQSYHCLVVTATQANAASYKSTRLSMGNFSEDKRKNSHVTGMIGINQTPEEKEQQYYRLNWMMMREGDFNASKFVYVGNSLALSNPSIVSCF